MAEFEQVNRDYSEQEYKKEGSKPIKIPMGPFKWLRSIRIRNYTRVRDQYVSKANEYRQMKQSRMAAGARENDFINRSIDKKIGNYEIKISRLNREIYKMEKKNKRPRKLAIGSSLFASIYRWYQKRKQIAASVEEGFDYIKNIGNESEIEASAPEKDEKAEESIENVENEETVEETIDEDEKVEETKAIDEETPDIPEVTAEEEESIDLEDEPESKKEEGIPLTSEAFYDKITGSDTYKTFSAVEDLKDSYINGSNHRDISDYSLDEFQRAYGTDSNNGIAVDINSDNMAARATEEARANGERKVADIYAIISADMSESERVDKIAEILYEQSLSPLLREKISDGQKQELVSLYKEVALKMIKNEERRRVLEERRRVLEEMKRENERQKDLLIKSLMGDARSELSALSQENDELADENDALAQESDKEASYAEQLSILVSQSGNDTEINIRSK